MMLGLLWWVGVIVVGIILVTLGVVFRGAPYLPSRRSDLEQAFNELYQIGPDDTLVDVGSGDGGVLREAARRGARAVGVEINPFLVLMSRWLSRRYPSVLIKLADMWRYDLPPETTIVYVFGTGRDVSRTIRWVEAQVAKRSKPLYVMSYGFRLPWVEGRSIGAHHLYQVAPLHDDKPQV